MVGVIVATDVTDLVAVGRGVRVPVAVVVGVTVGTRVTVGVRVALASIVSPGRGVWLRTPAGLTGEGLF
jgi:hypothetical protein